MAVRTKSQAARSMQGTLIFIPLQPKPGYTLAETAMLIADKVRAALEELAPTQEKVDLAVKTTVEIAQPSRVILFGSWPRGEARWDSDLDMDVPMPNSFLNSLARFTAPSGRSSKRFP